MIIYKATNVINNKCYIGQTVKALNKRIKEHKASSKTKNYYFHKAIRKYGWDNFTWKILCVCETKKEMDEMEFHYIKQYYSRSFEYGYNVTEGGDDNPMFSAEARKKMSIINKGSGNPMFGKCHSEETRKKMKNAKNGRFIGKNNPNYGNTGEKNPISQEWILTTPSGKKLDILCLAEFCREHDLNPCNMSMVAAGKNKTHKGWGCIKKI